MPSVKNPHLTIVKDATETSYNAVGDVIHYTIIATNDGNTTLTNVTVTDPNAGGLNCTPQTPVSAWPRAARSRAPPATPSPRPTSMPATT